MQTTIEFLDAVKARHSLPSDYALAPVLGITRSAVSKLRNKQDFLGDQTALKVAELLDLSPGIVLSAVHAERAKDPAEKSAWNSIFEKLGGLAASVMLFACFLPSPAEASIDAASRPVHGDSVYYVK